MATKADKKTGGAKTSRSEIVTVRLDPKMRYLAELAARTQRRTLSSYIEWAIEESLKQVDLPFADGEKDLSVDTASAAEVLWDVEESDRFYYLARALPGLLTHEEQILWKLINGADVLWTERDGKREMDGKALRKWFPGAKFAMSTGADLDIIRAALNGDVGAVEAIGLDKWAKNRLSNG